MQKKNSLLIATCFVLLSTNVSATQMAPLIDVSDTSKQQQKNNDVVKDEAPNTILKTGNPIRVMQQQNLMRRAYDKKWRSLVEEYIKHFKKALGEGRFEKTLKNQGELDVESKLYKYYIDAQVERMKKKLKERGEKDKILHIAVMEENLDPIKDDFITEMPKRLLNKYDQEKTFDDQYKELTEQLDRKVEKIKQQPRRVFDGKGWMYPWNVRTTSKEQWRLWVFALDEYQSRMQNASWATRAWESMRLRTAHFSDAISYPFQKMFRWIDKKTMDENEYSQKYKDPVDKEKHTRNVMRNGSSISGLLIGTLALVGVVVAAAAAAATLSPQLVTSSVSAVTGLTSALPFFAILGGIFAPFAGAVGGYYGACLLFGCDHTTALWIAVVFGVLILIAEWIYLKFTYPKEYEEIAQKLYVVLRPVFVLSFIVLPILLTSGVYEYMDYYYFWGNFLFYNVCISGAVLFFCIFISYKIFKKMQEEVEEEEKENKKSPTRKKIEETGKAIVNGASTVKENLPIFGGK